MSTYESIWPFCACNVACMSYNEDMRTIASWEDVEQKARRLLSLGKIELMRISTYSLLATVHGDHGDYECYVNRKCRVHKDNPIDEANWYCTCEWGNWSNTGNRPHDGADSYGSVKSNDRFCSHAYACWLMLNQYARWHGRVGGGK